MKSNCCDAPLEDTEDPICSKCKEPCEAQDEMD